MTWQPPPHWLKICTIDMHTGGEPLRVIVDGLPPIEGRTVLEKRRYFREHYDHIRTGLMWEPRGAWKLVVAQGSMAHRHTAPEISGAAFVGKSRDVPNEWALQGSNL